jgi:hypothetical protein
MIVNKLSEVIGRESFIIKNEKHTFILKSIGRGQYNRETVATLFILLPNGDSSIVYNIGITKTTYPQELYKMAIEYSCFVDELLSIEESIEKSKELISKIYD